jgi:trigger factor
MKVTTERLEDCQIKAVVELDAAEIDKKLRETARKLSRQFDMPGYRRGRAPFHAVIRIFGREAVQQQALEDFGNELYEQTLEEIEFEPYEAGELEEVEWDPFRMTILVPIQPEVDLGDYRDVRVDYEVEEVTDEQVEAYLADLQQEHAQWVPVERPAAMGDQVVLDMEGKAGDELIMSNEGYEMVLEPDETYPLPGFHEQVVGMSAGEEKTFTLTMPEDESEEEVAGQEADVVVTLHAVKEQDMPELDDDLAMMVGDYETLDDLRDDVRTRLETEASQKAESEYLDKVLDAFVEAATQIEYPSQAIDRETDFSLNQMERNLAGSGLQLDSYLSMIGKTREAYRRELRPAAETRLQRRLVLNEIGEREGLAVDPEEIEAEIERMAEMFGPEGQEMIATLQTAEGRVMVANDLLTGKSQERATQIAKGEAPPLDEEAEPEEDVGEPDSEAETGAPETAGEEETGESAQESPAPEETEDGDSEDAGA